MNDRAAIFIGVSKTGGLRPLKAVNDGIRMMTDWALSQRITGGSARDTDGCWRRHLLFPNLADEGPERAVDPAVEHSDHVINGTENRHGIEGYLSDASIARRISDALTD